MVAYRIQSPSGRIVTVWGETKPHAINLARQAEEYFYSLKQYYDLN
jgi:hypothetical protein